MECVGIAAVPKRCIPEMKGQRVVLTRNFKRSNTVVVDEATLFERAHDLVKRFNGINLHISACR
jgi:hypothetical protein